MISGVALGGPAFEQPAGRGMYEDKIIGSEIMLLHEILDFPGSPGIPEEFQTRVPGLHSQSPHQGQVFLHGMVPQRGGRGQQSKGNVPVPTPPPGIVETYPGPGAGKPGIKSAPVPAGKLQDQIKAALP